MIVKFKSCRKFTGTIYERPEIYDDINYRSSKLSKIFAKFTYNVIKNNYGDKNNIKILDIGMGTGRPTLELYKLGFLTVGVDASIDMVEYAEKYVVKNNFEIICGDILDNNVLNYLENRYGTFDVVTMFYNTLSLFKPLDNLIILLKTISKLLKNNGIFIADVTNPISQLTPVRVWLIHRKIENKDYFIYNHSEINLITFDVKGILIIFIFENGKFKDIVYDVQFGKQYPLEVYKLLAKMLGFKLEVYGDFNINNPNPARANIFNLVFKKIVDDKGFADDGGERV